MNEFELGKELSTVEADVNSLRDDLNSFTNDCDKDASTINANFKLAFDALNQQIKKNNDLEARMVKNDLICLGYSLFVGLVCLATTYKVTKNSMRMLTKSRLVCLSMMQNSKIFELSMREIVFISTKRL